MTRRPPAPRASRADAPGGVSGRPLLPLALAAMGALRELAPEHLRIGVGGVMAPQMEKEGYERSFGAAVNITAATTGLLIPPSNILIVYSLASGGVSIAGSRRARSRRYES